jgi:hypothetical protein
MCNAESVNCVWDGVEDVGGGNGGCVCVSVFVYCVRVCALFLSMRTVVLSLCLTVSVCPCVPCRLGGGVDGNVVRVRLCGHVRNHDDDDDDDVCLCVPCRLGGGVYGDVVRVRRCGHVRSGPSVWVQLRCERQRADVRHNAHCGCHQAAYLRGRPMQAREPKLLR